MTDLPQWAVERAKELVTGVLSGAMAAHDIGQTPEETGIELAAYVARALADAAPKWRTDLENAPKDGAHILIYAGGEQFVAFWAVSIEEGDGQWVIARSPGMAFIVRNPTHWAELPAAPEVG